MNIESDRLKLVQENGLLKVIGTEEDLNNITLMKISGIIGFCELDKDSFQKLVNLEELWIIDSRHLILFPPWIREFRELKKIRLCDVSLCTKDDNLLYLPACLEEISMCDFHIRHCSNSFSDDTFNNTRNLKDVSIMPDSISKLPTSLFECTSIESLSVDYRECLWHLQENLQKLVNLKSISIYDSYDYILFTDVLNTIANLKNLEHIFISGGRYYSLPESFKELSKLKSLILDLPDVLEYPKWIGGFESLTEFSWFSDCCNHKLPNFVKNLPNLHKLALYNSYSGKIPDSIFELTNLTSLDLGCNDMNKLPESIGNLVNLSELRLVGNKLTKLPDCIGDLGNLERLDLSHNRLTSLPQSIRNLSQLTFLDLQGNIIPDLPKDDCLGRIELMKIFGDKVFLDDALIPWPRLILEKDVYKKLRKKRLCWNFEKLKTFKPSPIQKTTLDEKGMTNTLRNSIGKITVDECNAMVEYVRKLYNPKREYGWYWTEMVDKYADDIKNMLGSILESDAPCVDLSLIAEAIKEYCPDRQIAELKQAYYMIHGRSHSDDLEEFVSMHITTEKEYIFDNTITPRWTSQSVLVLNYWKHRLRDILGFEFDTNTRIIGEDPYRNSNGNALDDFFSVFTPEHVIKTLTNAINNSKPVMCELMQMIVNDKELVDQDKQRMGLAEDDMEYESVNEKAVEYYLLKKDILVTGNEDDDESEEEDDIVKVVPNSCCLFPTQFIHELFF